MYEVYLVANTTNSKVYVGITCKTFARRWNQHIRSKRDDYFHNAIRKHGADVFRSLILATAETAVEAEILERQWISDLQSHRAEFGYNCTLGGDIAGNHTPHTRAKISRALRGNQYRRGIPHPEADKQKIAEGVRRAYSEGRHAPGKGRKPGVKQGPMSEAEKKKRSDGVKRARAAKFWSTKKKIR